MTKSKEFISKLKQDITDKGYGNCVAERIEDGNRLLEFQGKFIMVVGVREFDIESLDEDKGGE